MIGLMNNHFTHDEWVTDAFASKLRTPLALNHQDTCKQRAEGRWVLLQLPERKETRILSSLGFEQDRKHQGFPCVSYRM